MTTFIRLLDVPGDDKAAALKSAVTGDGAVFECAPESFAAVPGSPFAYWVSESIRDLFSACAGMSQFGGETKCGLGTLDDFRFLRLWSESHGGR